MLSLDSIVDQGDVRAFDQRMKRELETDQPVYTAEPKFDGLSVELVYDQGALRSRRDAWRRNDHGCHGQSAHDPLAAPQLHAEQIRRRIWWSAAKSTCGWMSFSLSIGG